MPSFAFTGLVTTMYPFNRDALGQPLGEVQPGDVRDLDEPLDWQWVPAGDPPPPGAGDGQAGPPDDPAGTSETGDPAAVQSIEEPDSGTLFIDAPAPDGPQPAPPAVVPAGPQPFAVTTGQQ